ncbi:MAG: hypothetical protein DYG94_09000 [Leptolyngbya sp. PLA3]|nr:MAG: hypothetical protein EDM82_02795 [Cyanobacteria bacterium CYA]MCE7968868.1 hypothetical protein [Leptolyngbya sp. PL-A3]
MSTIDALGATSANSAGSTSAFSALTSKEFVEIMFTELTNQDPFEPNDSQAMLDQLSSLRSIESDIQLGERLDKVSQRTEFAAASQMIGKLVSGISETSSQVVDVVFSVSQTDEGPVLNLMNGQRVRMDNLIEVTNPELGEVDDDTE